MPVKNTAKQRAIMIKVNLMVLGCALFTLSGEAISSSCDAAIRHLKDNGYCRRRLEGQVSEDQ